MTDVDQGSSISSGTLLRARNGDDSAWDSIWMQYSARVYRQALRFGISSHDADEVTLEVFRKVWSGLQTFSRENARQSLGAWINRITRTTVLDFLKRKRSAIFDLRDHADDRIDPAAKLDESSSIAEPSPVWLALWQALGIVENECSDRAWECFKLARFANLPHKEIGKKLGMSDSNVSTTVRRVFEKIRNQSVVQLRAANYSIDEQGCIVSLNTSEKASVDDPETD